MQGHSQAVVVRDLHKEFTRSRGLFDRRRSRRAALNGVSFAIDARRVRRDPGPERLGQVDARPRALDAAARRRRRGARLRARRVHGDAGGAPSRQPRLGRGELLQEDERGREPLLRGAVLRHDAGADPRRDPADPRARRLPGRPPRRGDGAPVARDAAEGRARAGPAHLAGAAAARRADDGPRPALEAGGAGVHPRDPGAERLDDPALHARHARGRGARRPRRPARPRRAAVPRAGRRR